MNKEITISIEKRGFIMKTMLVALFILSITMISTTAEAGAKLKSYKYIANNTTTSTDADDLYSDDLNRVEMHLYHKAYPTQTLTNRLGRIEKTLFRQTYGNLSYTERVNNILSCYQDYYNTKNYVSNYYSPNLFRRMYSRYHGYPTGLTPAISPSILNTGFLNSPLNGYNNFYRTNRGYRYYNTTAPTMGAGIRILD